MATTQQPITGATSLAASFHECRRAASFAYTDRLTAGEAQAESVSNVGADALTIMPPLRQVPNSRRGSRSVRSLAMRASGLTRATKPVHAYPRGAPVTVRTETESPVNTGDSRPGGAQHFALAMHRTQESPVRVRLAPSRRARQGDPLSFGRCLVTGFRAPAASSAHEDGSGLLLPQSELSREALRWRSEAGKRRRRLGWAAGGSERIGP